MRTRAVLSALGGISLMAGAAFALASVWFPTPAVSVSTLTIPAPDSAAIVMRWTKRCASIAGAAVCPTSYDVRVMADYGRGFATIAHGYLTTLRDTLRFERPLCPDSVRVRVEVAARAYGSADRSATGVSLWQRIQCSDPTPAEIVILDAYADSFPQANRRIAITPWAHKLPKEQRDVNLQMLLRASRSAADSAKHRSAYAAADRAGDSVYIPQSRDTGYAHVGFEQRLCLLGRNRYTGRVVLIDGDVATCEPARVAFENERAG